MDTPSRWSRIVRGVSRGASSLIPQPDVRLPFALLLTAVAAAALAGWARWQVTAEQNLSRDRAAVLVAAREEVLALTTVSKATAAVSLEKLRRGAAEPFASDIAQSSGALHQVLTSQDVSSTGVIVESGVTSLEENSAVVLLAADATVSSAKAAPSVRHYRLSARMTRAGDRWLVSDLAFVS